LVNMLFRGGVAWGDFRDAQHVAAIGADCEIVRSNM
jgi:hypothetical protein